MRSRIRCARCGKPFDPAQPFHFLCYECWDECGLYGDEESIKFWKIGSTFANGTWTDEEWKEFADSPVGQEMLHAMLDNMDVGCKFTLLRREIKKLT